jgi:predicted nucleotidyltransferase
MDSRQRIFDYLSGMSLRLRKDLGDSLSGVYVHGSLVNDNGAGFNEERSDVDLLITTSATHPLERVSLASKLALAASQLEKSLRTLLPNRDFLPISSFCLATDFELLEGVHKNRNTRHAFSIEAFRSMLSAEDRMIRVGDPLKDDLVGLHFAAWTTLAEAQRFRSKFISIASDGTAELPTQFDDPSLPLPKDLLRAAYLYSCLDERRDPAMVTEDDIAKGYEVVRLLLDSASKVDSAALEILRLIRTNRPGGKGDRRPLSSSQLLHVWELVSAETQAMLVERRRDSSKQSMRFAADLVNQELSRLGATDLEAVDMAIQLYQGEDLLQDGAIPLEVRAHFEESLYEFKSFSETNLLRLSLEWPHDIQAYLATRLSGEGSNESQCKVGFAGVTYSQTTIDRPVKLIVRPLSYWVTQQFNKEIAAHPENSILQKLRDKYAAQLFRSTEDYACNCPSSLYLELAIVTSDGYVPKLLKKTKHSVFGKRKGEPVATCGVEWGFSWSAHVSNEGGQAKLNVQRAVVDSLSAELGLDAIDVERWSVNAVAVQHAHLNAALLGVAHLKLTRGELLDRLKTKNKYFHDSPEFLPLRDAMLAVQADRGSGKWHQTALMRIQLIDLPNAA